MIVGLVEALVLSCHVHRQRAELDMALAIILIVLLVRPQGYSAPENRARVKARIIERAHRHRAWQLVGCPL